MINRRSLIFLTVAGMAFAQQRHSLVVVLIGPPGSGKSVQAKALSKKYKVPAISMQSLVRVEVGRKSSIGKALQSVIASGELVSAPEANALMNTRLMRPDAGKGFILDGYPTTPEQAQSLSSFLTEHKFPRPIVILLDAPDDQLKSRMELRHRADDDMATIERRIREYRDLGKLAAEWYGKENLLQVDASASVSVVTKLILAQIEEADTTTGFKVRPLAAPRN